MCDGRPVCVACGVGMNFSHVRHEQLAFARRLARRQSCCQSVPFHGHALRVSAVPWFFLRLSTCKVECRELHQESAELAVGPSAAADRGDTRRVGSRDPHLQDPAVPRTDARSDHASDRNTMVDAAAGVPADALRDAGRFCTVGADRRADRDAGGRVAGDRKLSVSARRVLAEHSESGDRAAVRRVVWFRSLSAHIGRVSARLFSGGGIDRHGLQVRRERPDRSREVDGQFARQDLLQDQPAACTAVDLLQHEGIDHARRGGRRSRRVRRREFWTRFRAAARERQLRPAADLLRARGAVGNSLADVSRFEYSIKTRQETT
jgi:hypothetical protein